MRVLLPVLAGSAMATTNLNERFEEFKEKFGKKYTSAVEELKRFQIFIHNVELAEKMQILDPTASYGHMSPLADMSEIEYSNLNNLPVTSAVLKEHAKKAQSLQLPMTKAPDSFDWREKGAVAEVKNQGQCGSCWSFATVASIEGNNFVTNGDLVSLSEQELVDCDTNDNGCNGGLPTNAYEDLISTNTGLELESAYPYSAAEGKCKAEASLEKVFVSSYVQISSSEDQMATALMKYGPLAIGINATPMQMYMGGISDPWLCNPSALDHGVTIVAFGTGSKPFWTIKNSWGAEWGEEGYYRIVRGKGKCGLNRMVATAIVKTTGTTQKLLGKPELYV